MEPTCSMNQPTDGKRTSMVGILLSETLLCLESAGEHNRILMVDDHIPHYDRFRDTLYFQTNPYGTCALFEFHSTPLMSLWCTEGLGKQTAWSHQGLRKSATEAVCMNLVQWRKWTDEFDLKTHLMLETAKTSMASLKIRQYPPCFHRSSAVGCEVGCPIFEPE